LFQAMEENSKTALVSREKVLGTLQQILDQWELNFWVDSKKILRLPVTNLLPG
jgi:hypothetical protein